MNKERAIRNNQHAEHALLRGGIVRCGACGRSLYARYRRDRGHMQYQCTSGLEPGGSCRHGMDGTLLDAAVWRKVEQISSIPISSPTSWERLIANDTTTGDLGRRRAVAHRDRAAPAPVDR